MVLNVSVMKIEGESSGELQVFFTEAFKFSDREILRNPHGKFMHEN
jgi:hypothetical protein